MGLRGWILLANHLRGRISPVRSMATESRSTDAEKRRPSSYRAAMAMAGATSTGRGVERKTSLVRGQLQK